ncbi:MAG TPA: serine hydrolase, partial [Rectinemataceae bacterium]
MRFLRRLLPLLITLASAAALVYIPDFSPEGYADLQALFTHERTRQANAGLSVVVVRDGKVVFLQSFGKDGAGQMLAKDSPLYLGPSSELLSGALLSSLAMTGQLDLDKPISTYLPNLPVGIEKTISAKAETGAPGGEAHSGLAPESGWPTVRQLASYSVPVDRISMSEFRARTIGLEA